MTHECRAQCLRVRRYLVVFSEAQGRVTLGLETPLLLDLSGHALAIPHWLPGVGSSACPGLGLSQEFGVWPT